YFANIGATRRRGIEAGLGFKSERWQLHADYALLDATFRSALASASPNNPAADENGQIQVRPGDRLPSLPQHRLKAGVDYAATPRWNIGLDLVVAGSQYLRGDESNSNPRLPGFWRLDLHSRYRLADNLE